MVFVRRLKCICMKMVFRYTKHMPRIFRNYISLGCVCMLAYFRFKISFPSLSLSRKHLPFFINITVIDDDHLSVYILLALTDVCCWNTTDKSALQMNRQMCVLYWLRTWAPFFSMLNAMPSCRMDINSIWFFTRYQFTLNCVRLRLHLNKM